MAAPPLRGGVPGVAAERAADGLLSAGHARARRAAARRGDAAARRLSQRGDCTIEDGAVRTGLAYVQGCAATTRLLLSKSELSWAVRVERDLAQRVALRQQQLIALVETGACDCFGLAPP